MPQPTVAEVIALINALDVGRSGPVPMLLKERVLQTLEGLVGPLEMPSYPYLSIARRYDVDYGLVLGYLDQIKNNKWPSEMPVAFWPTDYIDNDKHRAVFGETAYAWLRERDRRASATEGTGNGQAQEVRSPGVKPGMGGGVDDGC
jgi:hypothetical protein